jgi:hypothetical protein
MNLNEQPLISAKDAAYVVKAGVICGTTPTMTKTTPSQTIAQCLTTKISVVPPTLTGEDSARNTRGMNGASEN